ncbi:sigma 54-interacting transcriptional regulator [Pseudenhygromyxa sp. WMMC2535]|uniref:sigma 54-interacting transcriptional regulator n=1 Tax=Pseudenhygromyxa sp. WMMC2535 TaxID=2712867 RepID=UPI001554C0D2|nr:sigma 54-interacting transcriptional regulator [Pseudenhygromyxa sp. WMMC2535]NVB42204.1 sigma 54-interacting transcriptional regulator [Pseudenhygromyxa sp. WMMC2535]
MVAPDDDLLGTLASSRFGDVQRLGAGAEGGTWIAHDPTGRSVVLKHVPAGRTATVARAFEVLRGVSSPHLPAALELIGDGRGGAWLVTGYVEGAPLGPGPVPLEQALAEALGVAHALAAIHGLGTHHGDVSANNVIVTPTHGVVLTDLGQLGAFGCGTPGFVAPEVLAGGGGPAADRFGVGSLLCLRLFGEVPWRRPEALLAIDSSGGSSGGSGGRIRGRLRDLARAAGIALPRPVEALLERLLDPDPSRRVADSELLVARLRQLQRASSAGELMRAHSAWWLPNRWRYLGDQAGLRRAAEAIEVGRCRVVAVVGPVHAGRGRVVEEIVGLLQVARARAQGAASPVRLGDAELLAASAGADESAQDWVAAWIDDGSDAQAGVLEHGLGPAVFGLRDPPPWPARLVDAPELQAAVLQAGARLGAVALVLPVDLALGRALAAALETGEQPGLVLVELERWSEARVGECLVEVVEDPRAEGERLARWAAAIHAATGGWPARVIRAIEACARVGAGYEAPDRAAVERALVAVAGEPRLDPETARRVFDRRWGLPVELPEGLLAGDEPLASAVAAARVGLGETVEALARATLEQARAAGRGFCLALALDANDASAVEASDRAQWLDGRELPSDLVAWLEGGGALEVGPRLRLRALRELIRRGQADRALGLLERIAETGRPSPAEALEGVRAREQLGRAEEALVAIDSLLPHTHGSDRDRALGLRWRALVDAGRAAEARAEAEAWAQARPQGESPSWRRAVAWLWGALARIYSGADPGTWLEAALDECRGEHGLSASREIAGLRARVHQLEANFAQLAGDGERARERYRLAAECFVEAGEGLGRVLVEGSLAAMAVDAGDLAEGLERGRRAVRGFLARAQVQTLPAACFNLVRALAQIRALDEGRRLLGLVRSMCEAAGDPSPLTRARLARVELELALAAVPGGAEGRLVWRRELAGRARRCAEALVEAGATSEAADARLLAAALLRVAARSEPGRGLVGQARGELEAAVTLARRASELAGGELELGLRLGVALETLAQAADGPALRQALEALAALPSPAELERLGQRQLAWTYDRTLLAALHRGGVVGEASAASVARRLLRNLETFMAKAPPLDRGALRHSLLLEAGEADALRELALELEAAEAEAEDAAARRAASEATHPARSQPLADAHAGEDEAGRAADHLEAAFGASAARPPAARGAPERPLPGSGEARLQQLLRVFRRLAREDELQRVLELVVDAMMELTDAERGVVCIGHGDARIEVAREMAWDERQDKAVAFSRSIIERVLAEGEPVLSVDAASDDRFDGSRSISHLNLRSVLGVPLIFRGEVLGAAYVDHRLRRGNFDAEDLAHMEDFADLAALAVAHARALAEVRRQADALETQRAELAELLADREAEVVNLREEVRSAPERRMYRGMVGSSKAMQRVFRLVDRLADSEVPVVIYGESGTGKELVARAMHDAGARAEGPFVAENCGAIPETLLESVLFGHARGAFTGAQSARPGLFEAADSGTIFLDEIGEMSPAMQTKLLRVLQEGEVRRLGETKARRVDVRVIAASNRSLEQMVEAGSFRQDLYYRINVVKLELPPLRERREDIPALIDHFLARHISRSRQPEGALAVSASALRKLTRYPWPGNVRELENEVQRWLALCEERVMPEDLSPSIEGSQTPVDDPDDLELRPRIERLERELIGRAMSRTEGNQTQAAQLLGLSRYGLQKKLKRLEEDEG